MGGNILTGLGAGNAAGESVRYEQLLAIATTGSANAYVLSSGTTLAAYATGQTFLIIPNFTNSGAATINVDTLGAKDITKNGTTALASGDLVSGTIYRIAYDGTQFQVVGSVTQDATLTALAALSTADNTLVRGTGTDTFEAIVSTPVAQQVRSATVAVATGSTDVPIDDTIPQNTEGAEFITLAITPKSASNILKITAVLQVSLNATNNVVAALFQDSTAGALAVAAKSLTSAYLDQIVVEHRMTAGTTSATTFKIRIGSAGGATTTLNGIAGARLFGGAFVSSITITELWA